MMPEMRHVDQSALTDDAQHLYDKIPTMLCSIDRTARFVNVNEYWLRAMGYTRTEVLGQPSIAFCSEASRNLIRDVYLPAFFQQGQVQDAEVQLIKKNGEPIDVLFSAVAERAPDGEIRCALGSVLTIDSIPGAGTMVRVTIPALQRWRR